MNSQQGDIAIKALKLLDKHLQVNKNYPDEILIGSIVKQSIIDMNKVVEDRAKEEFYEESYRALLTKALREEH